jgi:hypothetical protein
MLDEKIKVTREGVGDECIQDKLKPSRTGSQSRRTVLLESNRRNQTERSIVGGVGLAPSCGSLLEFFFVMLAQTFSGRASGKRLELNTDSWSSLTLLHIVGKDRGKSLIDKECRKQQKWPVCLLKGADEGKVAYNSIGGKVWRW